MRLGQIRAVLPQVDVLQTAGLSSREGLRVRGIAYDSRRTMPGDLFVAIPGARANGLDFVADAVRAGAAAVVVDRNVAPARARAEAGPGVLLLQVPDAREALARLAHAFHRQPSRKLDVIAVTGTNGKTTTAKMVQSILVEAGRHPAFFGTIGYEIGSRRLPAPNTTPASADLARLLREAVAEGHDAAVMEASSHAMMQHRLTGVRLRAAAFTNLSRDHQEYHGDMESYFRAKRHLFEMLPPEAVAAVQVADPAGRRLADFVHRRGLALTTCGTEDAAVRAEQPRYDARGSRFYLRTPAGGREVRCEMPGPFNVANAVTAAAVAAALGTGLDAIAAGIERLPPVPGRMERFVVPDAPAVVVVDYAHTHVALTNALLALAEARRQERAPGRLTVVFGCGGDRDPGRRPRMGRVAAEHADRVIVTSDNPRSEDPHTIIRDILRGVAPGRDVEVEPDRRRAIRKAVCEAGAGDVVLVAGKGHEDYQILGDVTVPFDDRVEVLKAIEERTGSAVAAAPALPGG
ncbi:MAG: UDP-N-acetylmuramoyl-L-alanyl-D-glutamate--2,6-diaminopimelate ligase [Planctomycetes bacterium]|nr:UDP-N-acetylmuramoyl-L-alanyl-D-glutamate--2,6-diaminopimelate ligase [Planctomycetota bacterium]